MNDLLLHLVMPDLPHFRRTMYLPHLQQAMAEFEIVFPLRQAAFLAQLAHESAELRFLEETWGPTATQRRYEPPGTLAARLGNTEPGDGKRFKGRGPIQITGRHNYRCYGDLLDLDLVRDPDQAARPETGFRIAGLYWQYNGLNELADQQQFTAITRCINEELVGLENRIRYYEQAKAVLGVDSPRSAPLTDSPTQARLPVFTRGAEVVREGASGVLET